MQFNPLKIEAWGQVWAVQPSFKMHYVSIILKPQMEILEKLFKKRNPSLVILNSLKFQGSRIKFWAETVYYLLRSSVNRSLIYFDRFWLNFQLSTAAVHSSKPHG